MQGVINAETSSLDFIGLRTGTDKTALVGDYLRHYEEWLAPLRNERFNLIEIGVFGGASVAMWREFFPNATIIGVDIDKRGVAYASDRIHIRIGSQADPGFLHQVVTEFPPTVIIDDGSHRSDHNIFTFERLFPALIAGGWYIVEDLHFNLIPREAERLRGDSAELAIDYFMRLFRDRVGSREYTDTLKGFHHYLVTSIDSARLIPQAIAFRKAAPPDQAYVDQMREYVTKTQDWLTIFRLAMWLHGSGASRQEVIDLLENAIKTGKAGFGVYERLADVYFEVGNKSRAADVLDEAITSLPLDEARKTILSQRAERFRELSM